MISEAYEEIYIRPENMFDNFWSLIEDVDIVCDKNIFDILDNFFFNFR